MPLGGRRTHSRAARTLDNADQADAVDEPTERYKREMVEMHVGSTFASSRTQRPPATTDPRFMPGRSAGRSRRGRTKRVAYLAGAAHARAGLMRRILLRQGGYA